tara:strand:+ start:405 stop:527 length:123 start_codon:yes stop_codon:yes gene_type:complete
MMVVLQVEEETVVEAVVLEMQEDLPLVILTEVMEVLVFRF